MGGLLAQAERSCDTCGAPYTPVKPRQLRCSARCGAAANNARRRSNPEIKRCRMCRLDLPVAAYSLGHRCCRTCEELRAAGRKRCVSCRNIKPEDAFAVRSSRPDGRESQCKSCVSRRSKRRNVSPAQRERNRELKYRLKYGITIADYDEMLAGQGGACAICRSAPSPQRRLHVDHDHASGRVRALLCLQCNALLGHGRDDTTILLAAIRYLERHCRDSYMGP